MPLALDFSNDELFDQAPAHLAFVVVRVVEVVGSRALPHGAETSAQTLCGLIEDLLRASEDGAYEGCGRSRLQVNGHGVRFSPERTGRAR